MSRIFLVEDDEGIIKFLKMELEHEGFEVLVSMDGREALELFEKEGSTLDIILLDIMLPSLSGLEVLRRIRRTSSVPVILLTARNETYDRVNGLDAGADDYVSKPFEIEELLARMRALKRRSSLASESPVKKLKDLTLNADSMEVYLRGEEVPLSKTEFMLLKCLMDNRNVVLSRSRIIDEVWGESHYIDENSVDVYIRFLRSKIDEKAGSSYISTIRGAGYVMRDGE